MSSSDCILFTSINLSSNFEVVYCTLLLLLFLKMLEIHERFECGVPVIIEGETGVGKTALVEMLSILWNDSLLGSYDVLVNNIYTLLNRVSEGVYIHVCRYFVYE